MPCKKTHTDVPSFVADLPESQKVTYRHICAGCAYEEGYKRGVARATRYYEKKFHEAMSAAQQIMSDGPGVSIPGEHERGRETEYDAERDDAC